MVEDTVVSHERAVGWAVYAAVTAALVVPQLREGVVKSPGSMRALPAALDFAAAVLHRTRNN